MISLSHLLLIANLANSKQGHIDIIIKSRQYKTRQSYHEVPCFGFNTGVRYNHTEVSSHKIVEAATHDKIEKMESTISYLVDVFIPFNIRPSI